MNQAVKMDRMYRYQRHFYDLTRRHYLLGRDRLLNEMVVNGGDSILEVGCGTGRNLIRLGQMYPGARLYGLDAAQEMLKTCNRKMEAAGLGIGLGSRIMLRQGLAEDLSYDETFGLEAPFDLIFFSYSLSMIPTWRDALDVAIKNLKPSGNMLILDFGDGTDLPKWLRFTVKKWLALFDVHYRPEMLRYLETIDGAGESQLSLTPIAGRYSYLAHFQKR
jgi:S-adenosylmethionine-diacylgycerolhomoserine-N-methlytransferase